MFPGPETYKNTSVNFRLATKQKQTKIKHSALVQAGLVVKLRY